MDFHDTLRNLYLACVKHGDFWILNSHIDIFTRFF